MKVLVVDDDVVARMMLMHLVDSCGSHAIVEAGDGADAWHQLNAGLRPDIVFCDLRMPHLSGLEMLQRVRAHAPLAALPFVLVSAAADSATLDEAALAGASGYIVKPFRQDDVRAQFERLFDAPDMADAAQEVLLQDEAPQGVARRLAIDLDRLRLYLDALARQLQAAARELPAAADAVDAAARLARLREGCVTLGLHGAAAALDRAPLAAALAHAGAAVARQIERASRA